MDSKAGKRNYVKGIPNPEDKRSKHLVLPEYAESKREEFIVLANSIEKEMTEGLSDMEAEVLAELLTKVTQQHNSGRKL